MRRSLRPDAVVADAAPGVDPTQVQDIAPPAAQPELLQGGAATEAMATMCLTVGRFCAWWACASWCTYAYSNTAVLRLGIGT